MTSLSQLIAVINRLPMDAEGRAEAQKLCDEALSDNTRLQQISFGVGRMAEQFDKDAQRVAAEHPDWASIYRQVANECRNLLRRYAKYP